MKVYIKSPEKAVAMTMAGVQMVCVGLPKTEWPDQVFECVHEEGISAASALEHYISNMRGGLRFYVEAE